MANRPTLLHWFPRDPEKMLARLAHLSPEAFTAFTRLRDHAWLASSRGDPACTLTTDEAELERLAGIGRAWAKVADKVKAMFTLDGGRLLDVELYDTWKKQQAGYDRRKTAGEKGGKAKAKRKQSDSNARAKSEQQEQELEGEQNAGPSDPGVLRSPASDDALAPDAPRVPAAGTVAADVADLEQRRLERDYAAWLRAAFDEWTALHPEEYAEIRRTVMTAYAVPFTSRSKPFDELLQYVRDGLLAAVRAKNNWPDADAWIAQHRTGAAA